MARCSCCWGTIFSTCVARRVLAWGGALFIIKRKKLQDHMCPKDYLAGLETPTSWKKPVQLLTIDSLNILPLKIIQPNTALHMNSQQETRGCIQKPAAGVLAGTCIWEVRIKCDSSNLWKAELWISLCFLTHPMCLMQGYCHHC